MAGSSYQKPTRQEIAEYNKIVRSKRRGVGGKRLRELKQQLKLTPMQTSVLIGVLLGDATINASPFRVKFEQSYVRQGYIFHLYEIFESWVGTEPTFRKIENSFHTDYGVSFWFRTYGHSAFEDLADLFYHKVNGKRTKRVVDNIHEFLNDIALAYWFMDDGSYDIHGNLYLHTQGFTQAECFILIEALKRNFDISASIAKDKSYYRIFLNTKNSVKLAKIVLPYVHSDLKYKLQYISY